MLRKLAHEKRIVEAHSSRSPVTVVKMQMLLCAATFLFFSIIFYFVIRQHRPPRALTVDAPLTEFSSGRAMQHLRAIAQSPHPIGAPAHDQVRDYIVETIARLKLTPEIQAVEMTEPRDEATVKIENIMARVVGTDPGRKAVMLVAHYDSAPRSYGASDDGAGVAALLETLRALKSNQPLKKDIIALFTDGEEFGQLGARAFLSRHQWADNVELVLNFEARGSQGPVFMFETSDNKRLLIKEFARAAPAPFANSLAQIIYEYLPHSTDLDIFREAGYHGLNFAFIDAAYNYHNDGDNLKALDEGSVQHHGSYALSLARHFGNLELERSEMGDVVYFDLLGKVVVYYSNILARALTVFNAILFSGILIYGIKKRALLLGRVALGGGAFILSVACAMVGIVLSQDALSLKHGGQSFTRDDWFYFIFFTTLAISVVSGGSLYFTKWLNSIEFSCGVLLIHLIILGVVTVYLSESSYILAWPLLFTLIGLGLDIFYGKQSTADLISFVCHSICTLPVIILLLWTVLGVFQGIGLYYPLTLMISISLFIGFFLPFLKFVANPFKWFLPSVSALANIIILTVIIAIR